MSDFTKLLNQGIRRYIDKYTKRRDFGRCDECGARTLLVQAVWDDEDGTSTEISLCNDCYDEFVREEAE